MQRGHAWQPTRAPGELETLGPYLSERQWATCAKTKKNSEEGASWEYFPHDQARSRAYRWARRDCSALPTPVPTMFFAGAWNGREPDLEGPTLRPRRPEAITARTWKECYFYSIRPHAFLI